MRRLFIIRRVSGRSMQPTLQANQLIVASGLYLRLKVGDIVVLQHEGLEKIKRVSAVGDDYIEVLGDNPPASTDSRHFGRVPPNKVLARVTFPVE